MLSKLTGKIQGGLYGKALVIWKNMKSDGEIQDKGSVGMGNLIVWAELF
jgi:hypothetical protein